MTAALVLHAAPPQQPVPAKAKAPAKPKPGTVSGHVFAITASGDLKPARIAKVYLFSWHGGDGSAAAAWADEMHKYLSELPEDYARLGKDLICRKELLTYDAAVVGALKWVTEKNATDQAVITDADEEGNFAFKNVAPGLYTVLATGRAGFNEARWLNPEVTVRAGYETALKLSSPEKACVVAE